MRYNRMLQDGAVYHVTARVNNREYLLEKFEAKRLFEVVLIRAKKKYSFRVENFVIMGNHVHLILQPNDGCLLSRLMQWILSVFASLYNKIHKRTGHFWGERFFSRILNSILQYLKAHEYVNLNPLTAGLVEAGTIWRFSGEYHRHFNWHFILDEPTKCFSRIIQFRDPFDKPIA